MIADLRDRRDKAPFVPFTIRTSDGRDYAVPTVDHIYFPPGGHRVVVANDKGFVSILTPLHITAIVEQANGV
jgi:hypothetical protein